MASPNPYIVAYFSSSGRRQVSAFANTTAKQSFITYLESIDGVVFTDWYELASDTAVDDAINRTADLGGTVYNMPVN
ncbi:hypothetical protein BKA82DRAFT_999453 [Pisolithus tinctorius]|uniref:Uncharacterized protein n=1 Tax=Pisolithus tinctorius Marx 270 TaxID=870435 RepID=A0A0C3PEH0_PISTI|nr:hypothetical protein BKA82DRAFT_999453 [Pisolithus tinctorius]KIO06244.1 hypothetical protein M404DRAFT_999453 [Pisolithus tinctorius Marx 270]